MSLARTVDQYLGQAKVRYDLLDHPHTANSQDTARAARLPGKRVAKAVILRDRRDGRSMMAVLPATNRINFRWLRDEFNLDLEMVKEPALRDLFPDCEAGAVPPLGPAYHLMTLWDESLDREPEVYFEAGDHEHLLRLPHQEFEKVFEGLPHGVFSSEH